MAGASQDFRDGAATGAALVAQRARALIAWGVPVDDRVIDKLAERVVYEYGGVCYIDGIDPRRPEPDSYATDNLG